MNSWIKVIRDVAGGKKWLGCYDNQTRAPPPPPRTWIKYTISVYTPTQNHHQQHDPFRQRGLKHQNFFFFLKDKNPPDEGPIETRIHSSKTDLLLSIRYSLRNGAHGRPANSLQTSAMHFSAQPQLPHKPIVVERRAWPPLSLALPFSSSFFDSEEQSGRRCSRRAVEGESAISPSLPVLNSLMKFRSEQQWRKRSHTVVAIFTCLSVFLWQSFSAFLCLSPCLN